MGLDRRRTPHLPGRAGGRRIRDSPALAQQFDRVLLSISDQLYDLQGLRESTLQELVDGSGLSDRGLLDIFKTTSDPKISTLVRLAAFFGRELKVSFRPPAPGTAVR